MGAVSAPADIVVSAISAAATAPMVSVFCMIPPLRRFCAGVSVRQGESPAPLKACDQSRGGGKQDFVQAPLRTGPQGRISDLLDRLFPLPGIEDGAGAVLGGIHGRVMARLLGGELDHVAIGIAEIDRVDEAVIGDAAHL